ncbi:urea transporter [Pseudomonas sp. MWU13-2105]|uniref:urea transporter n=1 Tax=Pseudomonas sp. MWU13-2105 TaxID=2935074 RepID=UPI00200ECF24|nr:urea transporter [Pseudomonas sp. MWU13-2105]
MPKTPNTPHCPDWATALLNGFSQIFLQCHPLCGLCCLLAILLSAPALLGGALLGGLAGLLTAQRRDYPKAERQAGLYSYNGVLLGLLLSQQLPWSTWLPPLIIAASGLSAILVRQWLKHAGDAQSLPAYTAPFVGLGWLLLACITVAQPNSLPPALDNTIAYANAVFISLGQIMFLDQPLAALSILIGLLLANRRAAFWALLGSTVGLALTLLHDPASHTQLGLAGYNPALVALALSQRQRTPWPALIGILLASLLTPGFSALGLAPLTAPFILASWLVQAGARVLHQTSNSRQQTQCWPAKETES